MLPPKSNQIAHYYIDAARAAAALAVLWHHSGSALIDTQATNWVETLFSASVSYGHQSVAVFFVLSGYLVGSSWMKWRTRSSGAAHYAVDRLSRLYTALVPALVLTASLDATTYFWLSRGNDDSLRFLSVIGESFGKHYNPGVFVGNLLFQQQHLDTFGTNSSLWSLAYEFSFYLMFPALIQSFTKEASRPSRILMTLLTVCFGIASGQSVLLMFPLWLLGATLFFLPSAKWAGGRTALVLATGAVLSVLVVAPWIDQVVGHLPGRIRPLMRDLPISVAFAVWLYASLNQPEREPGRYLKWFSHHFAKISYTLYLVHLPVVVFAYCLLIKQGRLHLDALSMVTLIALNLVCLAIAYGMWWLFESRTDHVRRRLKAIFGMGV